MAPTLEIETCNGRTIALDNKMVSYQDEDGDTKIFSREEDIRHYFSNAGSSSSLRVKVKEGVSPKYIQKGTIVSLSLRP